MGNNSFLSKIKSIFTYSDPEKINQIPPGIKAGLDRYLQSEETVLSTLKSFRAIYKAPKWSDSNTFFNSWFILTNRRIIIAKNASSFNCFRDIALERIGETFFDKDEIEPKIMISSPGKEDIIEFPKSLFGDSEELEKKLGEAIKNLREQYQTATKNKFEFCFKCNSTIQAGSKFCPECGIKL